MDKLFSQIVNKKPKFWVIVAAVIILIVLAVALLGNPPEDDNGSLTIGSIKDNYINEEYGFTFEFPEDWKEKIDKVKIIEEEDWRGVTFSYVFDQDGNEHMQEFFRIAIMLKEDYEKALNDPPMTGIYLAEKGNQVYVVNTSLDNIILDKETYTEYLELNISLEEIKERFYLNDSDTIEDFLRTPKSDYMGYIAMMTLEENLFHLDKVEFLTQEDEERARELGIDINYDMPSGFMVYNPDTAPSAFDTSDETNYLLLNENLSEHKSVTKEEFIQYNKDLSYSPLYHIYTRDGYVTLIKEQYIP